MLVEAKILTFVLRDDGTFPNSRLPVLIYDGVFTQSEHDLASLIEEAFDRNDWTGSWRDGIYSYHHYHSTAHEVLGVYRGHADVQLGGPNGITHRIHAGDVLILPAGIAHKNLGASPDFAVIGAYPIGQSWDMNYGRAGERPQADENIARVPLPSLDPVYGETGALLQEWHP
jgi:uncharacterized protein YjlB